MSLRPSSFRPLVAVVAALALAACEGTGPNANVALSMGAPAQAGLSTASGGDLIISGSNGTLAISRIKLVVDEFELDRASAGCDDDAPGTDCESFEKTLFAVDVPLGTGIVTIARDNIAVGTYNELEFEVKDLEDELGDEDAARLAALLAQLRTEHPDWPARASMLVEGTFTPTGGEPQAFRTYFEAEIEVEYPLVPALVVTETGTEGVSINLRPDLWFRRGDGTVRNLAQSHYPTTQQTVQLEVEFEAGIRVEFD